MKLDDGIPAIPLWINGHAYFSVFDEFIDIREADGSVNFRVPKCGAEEIRRALDSARLLSPNWKENAVRRIADMAELGKLLDQFTGDFAKLIERETGKDNATARQEIDAAVALLKNAQKAPQHTERDEHERQQPIVAQATNPLLSALEGMIAAWCAGDAAIVLSDARAPSVLFALAELSARVGFPAGAYCLLHGDDSTLSALRDALGD